MIQKCHQPAKFVLGWYMYCRSRKSGLISTKYMVSWLENYFKKQFKLFIY